MKANFNSSMRQVLRHEGGYVDHPKDPGGATNLGITIGTLSDYLGRRATKREVKDLTVDQAIEIYRKKYAGPIRYDDLPSGLDHVTLDPAINSGPSRGIRWLQQSLSVKADGRMGPQTLKAANLAQPVATIKRACAVRMGFLRGLRTWGTFGKGWSRRVAEVEAFSVKLATGQDFSSVASREGEASKITARREKESSAIPAGTGAGSFTLEGLPDWGIAVVVIIAVVAVVMLWGQARHNKDRAEAYKKLNDGVTS